MLDNLITLLAGLREEEALRIVKDGLAAGEDPIKILEAARAGIKIVGERFAYSEYFIPDLIYSGEIMKQITEIVKPKLAKETEAKHLGKVVLGTVAGDIHDIGLEIVDFMLDSNGFEVYNLGVDVPATAFVAKIGETGASLVGLSGFLTLAFDAMKETVDAIKSAGLRNKVKIMIGGGQVDEQVKTYTDADAYGNDAMAAVTLARKWTAVKRKYA